MREPPHPPVGEPCIERAEEAGICQTDDDAGLGNAQDQIPARIIYELAHGQRKQENKRKDGKHLDDVHDEAPSQVVEHVGAVEHCSGEAEGGANHQGADRGVKYVPIGRRIHQADSEVSGDEGMEVRAGATHCEASRAGG